jgi:Carboxypeptidase regulatory-like domain/TonB dependent receptor-like, beta-barrel
MDVHRPECTASKAIPFGGTAVKKSLWRWALFCTLSAATLVFGQLATTSLRGVIKDPSGALVPGAKITLVNKANGSTLTATANTSGSYVFAQIPPAKYTITVTAAGFGDQTKSAELLVNQPATINFALTVQASSVTVDVSAVAQTLNTTDATLGDAVGNVTIEALPMEGRDPISLLTLQPGVLFLGNPEENNTMDSRSGSVSGGRSDQGNVTLDGMDDNDQINGTAFTGVLRATLDSTEEFRVTTSNGTADSGRSSGAQISIVTKSGTNKFHGAAYEYYRPTNTVANQWFNKYQQATLGMPNRPQKYVMNTFGASLGGPIIKDKLFFFGNYEGQRKAIDDVVTRIFPTQQFYSGSLGYQDDSGATHWLSSSDVTALDSDCNTNVPCGPNPYVQAYYGTLAAKGIYGTAPTAGDGVNNAGYIFSSPAPSTLNTSIAKIDYNLSNTQHIFVRGNLQKDTLSGDENIPGQPPATMHEDNTKGFAVGYTWTPTTNIVNDFRYGYIRQGYSTHGVGTGTGDWVFFRFLSQPTAHDLSTLVNVPVHNITDNLTWTKGTHTLSFGGNWRGITNNRDTDANSYSNASTNPYWVYNSPNAPADLGGGFGNSYDIAFDTLVGTVPSTTQQYNYSVTGPSSGTLFNDGSFINRHFKANEFEYFLQDAWRIKPSFTVTFGIRHSILQAPYETKGQQIAPTVDTHAWFVKRGAAAAQGEVFEDPLEFVPSGKANGRPGYWAKQKTNLAPRLSIAYAPNPRTTIRAGAGMYFDHFGQGIVNSFDQQGSFGLSSSVNSPAGNYGVQDSPRFTGPHDIPPLAGCPSPAATITYPFTPSTQPNCDFAITWGIDNHLKTPYSYALDFSLQRELPGGFILEENYVGRLGRHLLEQLDLAEPVNLVDTKGGGDYFHAGAQLSKISDENGGCNPYSNSPCTVPNVPTIQYFEDVFPQMQGYDYDGESATQAIYNNEWAPYRYDYGETTSLADLDFYCYYGCPNGTQFWQSQFSSLYAWSSIGTSSYHALQMSLRHPASHGLTLDVNYTFSKSIDIGSGAERSNEFSADSFGGSGIQNSWNPKLNKAVSDFDTRHLVTVDWVYELPFGRGRSLLPSANGLLDAVIGGWQLSGLSRWASGLPFSLNEPGWSTNWQLEGFGVVTSPVQIKRHIVNGVPQVFAGNSANTINNGVYTGSPIRLPYPGEAGQRNNFRGDGYFDVDSSLDKTWTLHEQMKLKFAAEVYNVGNNVRFDDSPANLNPQLTSGTLGAYGGMLTTYRRMQFGLRLDF